MEESFQSLGWEDFLTQHKTPVIIALLGAILIGGGILAVLVSGREEAKIEIISSEEAQESSGTILVDIEGAVEKPGVYELEEGSRLEDLLVACGGLSAQADREWAARSLNRAQKLTDGAKVYIPQKGEGSVSKGIVSGQKTTGITASSRVVNINAASASELEELWGIGPVTAENMIRNRPYQTVEELLERKILKSNVYERIKDELTVF